MKVIQMNLKTQLMNTLNKIDVWVNDNFFKYHLYTKTPLIILVSLLIYFN